jgi:hypothetical protein
MLAGLLWLLLLLTAYAVFVWYLWRETTVELAPAKHRVHFPFVPRGSTVSGRQT